MKKVPFVSVVIPTYNEEKYLESTLRSVKNQNYPGKYEIIVADWKSKDRTIEIAKKHANKVVRARKAGIGAGRNEGARVAKGDIVLFVDADTILLPNTLSEIVKVFGKKDVIGATCPLLPTSWNAKDFSIYWMFNQIAEASIKANRPQVSTTCCAYRKDVFDQVRGFTEEIKFEDLDLSKRISKHGKIVFVDKTLALTSARRIENWGRINSIGKYIALYLRYLFVTKDFEADNYKPVR